MFFAGRWCLDFLTAVFNSAHLLVQGICGFFVSEEFGHGFFLLDGKYNRYRVVLRIDTYVVFFFVFGVCVCVRLCGVC